ncbi:MAG: murein biosynthesis integral membrane protein MurJ [Desulfohalobiaceae bacterium]|nr:murein biosynthesis integral membrane protein MurJ [Desulfohalobiaceae bacterium]
MASISRTIARRASVVAGATFLSRILGFARDVVIAFALGTSPLADAFFVAFRLPNLLRRLFAEGSLTMAFVPVFSRAREQEGSEAAHAYARSALVWLLIVVGLVVAAGLLLARPLAWIIAPGFGDDPELFAFTVRLIRICFPYILFISAVALCMGILNSLGHFFAPAIAPCVLNLVLIGAALAGVASGLSVPVLLAWGVLLAGLGQLLLQQPFLHKQGFFWRGDWRLRDSYVFRMGRLMLPMVLGAAVYQLNIVVNTMLASFLPKGSISYLYYADRLVQFPLGVFGIAVGTAALPSFSHLAEQGRHSEFLGSLNTSLGLTLFICLPATAGLIGLSEPLVQTLFARGAFQMTSAQATAAALVGYSVGLPAFSCVRPLVSAYYALHDGRTPVIAASICLVVNAALGLWLMQHLAHVGLALAVSLASWLNILILGYKLSSRFRAWMDWGRGYGVMLLLSLLLGAGTYASASWGPVSLLLIPLWAGVYFVACWKLGLEEAEIVLDMLRRRGGTK